MRIIRLIALCASFLGASLMSAISPARAQDSLVITVDFAPPPLPVYDQPPIPGPGYIWEPGYWLWSAPDVGWYWVPGTWVLPPAVGLLWTPAYWAYSDGAYVLYDGYWASDIGFYGGIDYGFGYTGYGYEGGYWSNGTFFYNTAVNNITNVSITNVYHKPVVDRNRTRISYNGGPGGLRARPTPPQLAVARERHVPPTPEQRRHVEAAARNPAMALADNHGHPAVAATSHPGQFRGPGVVAAHPGRPIPAVPLTAARAARQVLPAQNAQQQGTNLPKQNAQPALPGRQPNQAARTLTAQPGANRAEQRLGGTQRGLSPEQQAQQAQQQAQRTQQQQARRAQQQQAQRTQQQQAQRAQQQQAQRAQQQQAQRAQQQQAQQAQRAQQQQAQRAQQQQAQRAQLQQAQRAQQQQAQRAQQQHGQRAQLQGLYGQAHGAGPAAHAPGPAPHGPAPAPRPGGNPNAGDQRHH